MTQNTKPPGGSPLERWSRLKREAARAKEQSGAGTKSAVQPPSTATAPPAAAVASVAQSQPPAVTPQGDPLPPIESLTIDSDFSAFLQPKVDEALKRQALKQLFRDPHFNVMDGLDIYIGDYTQPDPISPEIVRELVQGRYIFNPPPTRINAQGFLEDVPADELAALDGEAKPAGADASREPPVDVVSAPVLPPTKGIGGIASSAAPSEPGVDVPSPDALDGTAPPRDERR